MSENIGVRRDGAVMEITLQRPDRRNAITVAMYAALADAFEDAALDPTIRLVTIAGKGPDFTAGNDLIDFMTALPREMDDDVPVWRLLRAVSTCPKPILASVHGNCIGIGTTILLHCDLVIADEEARFAMPFVELGLVPEAASSLILPRLMGIRHASRLILLGEKIGAREAHKLGIVSHVAPTGQREAMRDKAVARLLAQPAEALAASRALLRQAEAEEIALRMREESALFAERLQSDELKAAIASFFASRAAAKLD